ncbi:conserved hypothetical protein [Ricinus communis]|uniref:Uncharacterized protein n=1 Tax=Ricinus communis TaxID=3988 RepID=B9T0N1_RICCO|nr:conserved hypothetical protein [Ricinus communis]
MSSKKAVSPLSIKPLYSLNTKVSRPKLPSKVVAKAPFTTKAVRRSRRIKQNSAFSDTSVDPLSPLDSSFG